MDKFKKILEGLTDIGKQVENGGVTVQLVLEDNDLYFNPLMHKADKIKEHYKTGINKNYFERLEQEHGVSKELLTEFVKTLREHTWYPVNFNDRYILVISQNFSICVKG